MMRSLGIWLGALWVGVMIHVDWHLGRPGHDHRSFDLGYHWLLAVPTFAVVAWIACRRWPGAELKAGLVMALLGGLLGQGLEPLGETIHFGVGAEPFTNPVRWRIFAEFIAAGLLTLVLGIRLFRSRTRATSSSAPT